MGYTHHWKIHKNSEKLSDRCLNDVKKVIEKYRDIIQYEDDNKERPLATKNIIRFNGIGENGHETFYVEIPPKEGEWQKYDEKGMMSEFCKTARKSYDTAVCEILLILKAELKDKMILDSDGFGNDICSFDGYWTDAIEEVKEMEYKINCSCYSRDKGKSPYYDCEIKEIEAI